MPSRAGCGRRWVGAAMEPRCHERRDRGESGFPLGFREGCRKCWCEWGARVSSPLPATVPGCRAGWVRGAGTRQAPRSPHSVLSCLALSTAAAGPHPAGPGATGKPNPELPSFPLPSRPVTRRVARNHRMPRLERALAIIPWLWAGTSSTRPGGSKLPVPWPRTLSGMGQLKFLGSLFHHLSTSENALLHLSVHVQSPSILCTVLP